MLDELARSAAQQSDGIDQIGDSLLTHDWGTKNNPGCFVRSLLVCAEFKAKVLAEVDLDRAAW